MNEAKLLSPPQSEVKASGGAEPQLIPSDNGRVLDLVQGDEVLQSFELVSAGLWAAFGKSAEGQRNLLHNADARAVQSAAAVALTKARHQYRETGPLNRVEQRVAPAIAQGIDDELRLLLGSPMLRSSLSQQVTKACYERGLVVDQ